MIFFFNIFFSAFFVLLFGIQSLESSMQREIISWRDYRAEINWYRRFISFFNIFSFYFVIFHSIKRRRKYRTKRLTKDNSSIFSLFFLFLLGTRHSIDLQGMKGSENFDGMLGGEIFWTIVERKGKRKREKILYKFLNERAQDNKFPIIEINLRSSIFLAVFPLI